jgi:hypothetical protein
MERLNRVYAQILKHYSVADNVEEVFGALGIYVHQGSCASKCGLRRRTPRPGEGRVDRAEREQVEVLESGLHHGDCEVVLVDVRNGRGQNVEPLGTHALVLL